MRAIPHKSVADGEWDADYGLRRAIDYSNKNLATHKCVCIRSIVPTGTKLRAVQLISAKMSLNTPEQIAAAPSPAIAEHHLIQPSGPRKHHQRSKVRPPLSEADRKAMEQEKFFQEEYNPYQRISYEELKWMTDRERGPQTVS